MFIKFRNDWDGHEAGEVIFMESSEMARRLMSLGVALSPTYKEIETKILSDHQNKMVKTYENKASRPTQNKRGRPRKPR